MTDQLRDVLTRIADRAEPAPGRPDAVVAGPPRSPAHARLVDRAAAVGVAVFALVASRRRPRAAGSRTARDPSTEPTAPGIPSHRPGRRRRRRTRRSRRDLAVGRRLRGDRQPHRCVRGHRRRRRLPPARPARLRRRRCTTTPRSGVPAWSGSACRRTGLRLAYGWHAPLPDETGQEHGFVPSGVRILDLRPGGSAAVPEDRRAPGRVRLRPSRTRDSRGAGSPTGCAGRADGRYLALRAGVGGRARSRTSHGRSTGADVLVEAYDHAMLGRRRISVYDTVTGTRRDVRQTRCPRRGVLGSAPSGGSGGRRRSPDDGTLVAGRRQQHGHDGRAGRPLHRRSPASGWSVGDYPYTAGLVEGSRRLLLETRAPSSHLLAVDLRSGAIERLRLDLTPVRVDLLGSDRPRHALAQVQTRRGGSPHRAGPVRRRRRVEPRRHDREPPAPTAPSASPPTSRAVDHPTRDFIGGFRPQATAPPGRARHRRWPRPAGRTRPGG